MVIFLINGVPIEEGWINRKNSEDFSQLINYQDEYAKEQGGFLWVNKVVLLMWQY